MLVKTFLHTSAGVVQTYVLPRDLVLVGVHDIGMFAQSELSVISTSNPASLDENQLYLSGDTISPLKFELRKNTILYVSAVIASVPFFSQLFFDEIPPENLP